MAGTVDSDGPFHVESVREGATYFGSSEFQSGTIFADHSFADHWIRMAGGGGDILHTQPLDSHCECGFRFGKWLSDWDPNAFGTPPVDYAVPATLPRPQDGIKPMTVGILVCLLLPASQPVT